VPITANKLAIENSKSIIIYNTQIY
jgi:hypothetical protein